MNITRTEVEEIVKDEVCASICWAEDFDLDVPYDLWYAEDRPGEIVDKILGMVEDYEAGKYNMPKNIDSKEYARQCIRHVIDRLFEEEEEEWHE